MTLAIERRYRFVASHLYRRPEWNEEANRRAFGKCANLPGHGHNYRLYVTVAGPVDGETGFLVQLAELDAVVERRILEPLDHQHLNTAVAEFGPRGRIPSAENLLDWIRRGLDASLPAGCHLWRLRLEEDEDLAAVWEP